MPELLPERGQLVPNSRPSPRQQSAKARRRLPAPKLALPGNAESYNPPSEYLFTDEERQTWERMDPSDRPLDFVPQRYASLRRVPLYAPLIKERFERCLDLYLCPREQRLGHLLDQVRAEGDGELGGVS